MRQIKEEEDRGSGRNGIRGLRSRVGYESQLTSNRARAARALARAVPAGELSGLVCKQASRQAGKQASTTAMWHNCITASASRRSLNGRGRSPWQCPDDMAKMAGKLRTRPGSLALFIDRV